MNEQGPRGGRDLALAAAASLLALVLVALPFDGLAEALLLLPAVLFVPGYAVAAALFPAATLPRTERLAYSVALSVCTAALGGLAWQLAFGLSPFAWASILAATTLAACEIARRRRAGLADEQRRRLSRRPRLDAPTALAVLVALALAVVAVRTAIAGEQDQRSQSHFTALWIVPSDGGSGDIEVGLSNHQGAVHDYRLVVKGGSRVLRDWEGRLGARTQGRLLLDPETFPPGIRLVATLFRDGARYRRVELQTEAGT